MMVLLPLLSRPTTSTLAWSEKGAREFAPSAPRKRVHAVDRHADAHLAAAEPEQVEQALPEAHGGAINAQRLNSCRARAPRSRLECERIHVLALCRGPVVGADDLAMQAGDVIT